MPDKNKKNDSFSEEKPDSRAEKDVKEDSWSEDQKNRSYYYDDASGYQVYLPGEDDDDEEDKPGS
jgi:hypothetical protein